jgi:putative cell wall-binding protein
VGLYELRFSSVGITRTATTELATPGSHQLGTCPVTRTYGEDRYRTSVAIGRVAAPSARTVVLASGEPDHLVDGLVAAPVARAAGAPLLLTAASALPSAVHDDLVARGATKAYVVGGTTAVSTAVRNTLTSMGIAVVPVAGVDRYATSVAAAQALRTLGGATDGTAWIGSGEPTHLVDALSAGGPAAAGREPILLTSRTSLPASVAGELKVLGTTKSYVLGSTDTISTTVEQQLPGPVRLGGADRYGTAALVAGTMPKGLQTVISSGLPAHLVDALPGGALGLPILLVSTSVPTATHDRLELSSAPSVHLLGGPDVVNPATARALSDQLR